ncbi:HAMP domain-containing sensor histidine kinase [Dictyobacter aurantiacus]|uniref:HAMP domain-containing protein n=1 Tax=Dictyobacter aurantiacus TaxID=1936993 RepID=A0A401ZRB6_9CHLR|nr:histidine kinase [Dictyobacter aurantiacus]GCE09448.1 hypothetical protein KDAU_67770 [Dictyobacter aurantiacus]
MRVMHWRVGNLFWRLTLTYLFATFVAALVTECSITLLPLLRDLQQPNVSPLEVLEKQGIAHVSAAPENISTSSDKEALRDALALPLFDDIHQDEPRLTFIALIDHNGRILTSTSCSRSQLLSLGTGKCAQQAQQKLTQLQVYQATQPILRDISTSYPSTNPIIHRLPTGASLVNIPIQNANKQITINLLADIDGSLSIQHTHTLSLGMVISSLWSYWQPAGFYFIFLASALGTVAGILISHDLTRRLRRITLASREWSKGEFQNIIHDKTHDELGQLSKTLNTMAEQLQLLLLTRKKLAIIEERTRLKRDLHDAVKQHLFAVQMQLSAVRVLFQKDAASSYQHLIEAEKVAMQAQQELATLIEALHPVALTENNLVVALQEFCHAWSERTRIVASVHTKQLPPLATEIELAIFRVTQEAFSNIARHSGAHNVALKLLSAPGVITLQITDDGYGFNLSTTHPRKHGIGLQSMRGRIEALKGLFTIESAACHGTSITAHIPLARKTEGE